MGQECFSPSACPCYCSAVLINTIQGEWIFCDLEPGWWRNPSPWAPSLIHRVVLSPFLTWLTSPPPPLVMVAPEGKCKAVELWKESGGWFTVISRSTQWTVLRCRHRARHTAGALLLLLIPPPEVSLSTCKTQTGEEVH